MARFRLALAAIAVLACACASTQKPYNPFKVPREGGFPHVTIYPAESP